MEASAELYDDKSTGYKEENKHTGPVKCGSKGHVVHVCVFASTHIGDWLLDHWTMPGHQIRDKCGEEERKR